MPTSTSSRKQHRKLTKGRGGKKRNASAKRSNNKGNDTAINDGCGDDSAAVSVSMRTKLLESLIWHILHSEIGKCSSSDEVEGTVDAIIDSLFATEDNEDDSGSNKKEKQDSISIDSIKDFLVNSLLEYLPDVPCKEQCTTEVVENVIQYMSGQVHDYKKVTPCNTDNGSDAEEILNSDADEEDSIASIDSDSDDNYIQEGECELCEREVKLTRHHMIPRSTWPRMKPRFLQAAPYFTDGNMEKAEEILSMAMPCKLSNRHVSSWREIKLFLSHYTCSVCKLCHAAVHRRFSNLELAETRNSVEALLEDEEIRKFCKWANKQRPQRRFN